MRLCVTWIRCCSSTANSVSSIPYPASDGDTLGSRHSTSSGRRSGSSDPSSSHSGQPGHSPRYHLRVIASGEDEHRRNPSSSSHSLASSEPSPALHSSQLLVSCRRPPSRTFYVAKSVSTDRPGGSAQAGAANHVCPTSESNDRSKHWHCGGGCDGCAVEAACSATNVHQPHCKPSLSENSVMYDCDSSKGHSCVHVEIHKTNSNRAPCCIYSTGDGSPKARILQSSSSDSTSFSSRHLHSDNKLLHYPVSSSPTLSSSSSLSSSPSHSCGKHTSVSQSKFTGSRHVSHMQGQGSAEHAHFSDSSQRERGVSGTAATSSRQAVPVLGSSSHAGDECGCDVARDLRCCHSNCQKFQSEALNDSGLSCSPCTCHNSSKHHPSDHSQQQHIYLSGHSTANMVARSRSCSNMNHDPSCCCCCESCLTPVHTGKLVYVFFSQTIFFCCV